MSRHKAGSAGIQVDLRIVHADGHGRCVSTTTTNLRPTELDAQNIDYSADVVVEGAPLYSITASLVLESDRTWFLADQGRLAVLSSSAAPWWPGGRFLVTERHGKLDRWEFPRFGRLRLHRQYGSVRIVAPILDRASCGLSVWPNARWAQRDNVILEVSRTFLDHLEHCAWIEPYPDGARAVLCLTDHSDFDSPEKARLLADCLVSRDICITKGVFPAADLPSSMPWEETGLDNEDYRDSIARLFLHGSEIAAHGFTPKRDAPPVTECQRRLRALRDYELTTWIDHGTGQYLFSRGGKLTPGLHLDALLEEHGIKNYWSYFDVWDNPFGNDPSVLAERSGIDVAADLAHASREWRSTTPLQAAWFGLHAFRNIVGDGNDVPIRQRPWRISAWRPGARWYRTARRIRRAPLGVYGRDGAVFQQSLQAPWVFDTVLLNHLALQLAPAMIDGLIRTGGLAVAHCYMACEHTYARGNVFRREGTRLAIDPRFHTALDYVNERQRAADVTTLSFAQLRRCLELFGRSRLRRTETGWTTVLVDCATPPTAGAQKTPYEPRRPGALAERRLDGVTFILPRSVLMRNPIVAYS